MSDGGSVIVVCTKLCRSAPKAKARFYIHHRKLCQVSQDQVISTSTKKHKAMGRGRGTWVTQSQPYAPHLDPSGLSEKNQLADCPAATRLMVEEVLLRPSTAPAYHFANKRHFF